jgi:type IV pilus assembly protein PilB
MATTNRNGFGDILIRRGVISPDQLSEAERIAREGGGNLQDSLVRLGYATGEEVMRALAQQHRHDFIELSEISIPESVI